MSRTLTLTEIDLLQKEIDYLSKRRESLVEFFKRELEDIRTQTELIKRILESGVVEDGEDHDKSM